MTLTASNHSASPRYVASMPMYSLRSTGDLYDRLWCRLKSRLAEEGFPNLPERLSSPRDPMEHWFDPRLLLSQTCGYPLVTSLKGRVRLIGTPRYRAEGCKGFRYRSWLIARREERGRTLASFEGRRLAINDEHSLSGCKIFAMLLPPEAGLESFFSSCFKSGSHRASIRWVRENRADIAAIDCVTWALLARHQPSDLQDIRIIGQGPSLPGLPLITCVHTTDQQLEVLRLAFSEVLSLPGEQGFRSELLIEGFDLVDEIEYSEILAKLHKTKDCPSSPV